MKSEKTRRHILEKTAPLFNERGFEGTSLADLERATGLTRGALYGNFRDKESIAGAAFAHSVSAIREQISQSLAPFSSNREKLEALLDFFARYVSDPPVPGGCPLLNTAVEADDHLHSMRPVVAGEIIRMVDFIAGLLEGGIGAGEFRKDTDARELAYTFFCTLEGAIMFSRVERSTEPMNIIVRHCKNKLDQISCNKKE